MALDDFVHEIDGRLLADLRLVITEMVTVLIRAGPGAPLSVRVEAVSPVHLRGEVEQEDNGATLVQPADCEQAAPLLDRLTTSWGHGPHPRRLWFEIEGD